MRKLYFWLLLAGYFCGTFYHQAYAQAVLSPLSHENHLKSGRVIYQKGNRQMHTAIAPYVLNDYADSAQIDSLWQPYAQEDWQTKNWIYRKIFKEHLIEVQQPDFNINLDFLPDLQIGSQNGKQIWLNTRGAQLEGSIGNKFYFRSYFFENQSRTPQYLSDFITENKVVPGQGLSKFKKTGVFDFAYSGVSLSYTPSKYINFQVGYDKNFIGDGYRSLLLSDNASNYPFVKLTGTLGNLRYMTMWAQFLDYENYVVNDDVPAPRKYGVFQYLDWNITDRLAVGFYQNIMWRPRGFVANYFLPIVFVRPIEFQNGTPDKVTLGLNASYKIADRYVAYGQFVINEFTAKEIFANNGYWANKQAGQIGIKGFDVFGVKRLNLLTELNIVRPYTYSASNVLKNYGHAAQSLAHPWGANFREWVGIVNYVYKRFNFNAKLNYGFYGLDKDGLNYGKDIYEPYTTRIDNYGVFIGHGEPTHMTFANLNVGYLLNPKNNLRIEFGINNRRELNNLNPSNQTFYTIGLRSSFRNFYTDF